MPNEQSSSRLSTIAAKYVNYSKATFWRIVNDGETDELNQLYEDIKSLAGSVLTQDETKGQGTGWNIEYPIASPNEFYDPDN